ncbi:MAG: nitrile hydratase accessory protein [Haloarculaceae archaeon]|jgi:nitrile hydratase accessory protein
MPEAPVDPAALAGREDEDGPTFDEPWQARAFGIAVALYDDGDGFEWSSFQGRLIEEVRREDPEATDAEALEGVYYEQWLAALERLLVEDGVIDPGELEDRAASFAAGDRTAEEFVAGEREH